jgi:hypothetical protein
MDEFSKPLLNILIDVLFKMSIREGLSKHIWFLVYILNFWTETLNVTSPDSVYIGGVPLCFYPASKWVSRQL